MARRRSGAGCRGLGWRSASEFLLIPARSHGHLRLLGCVTMGVKPMRVIFGAALLAAASPALAEDKIFSIEGEIAPQWATATPWDYDDITDSTSGVAELQRQAKLWPGSKPSCRRAKARWNDDMTAGGNRAWGRAS